MGAGREEGREGTFGTPEEAETEVIASLMAWISASLSLGPQPRAPHDWRMVGRFAFLGQVSLAAAVQV